MKKKTEKKLKKSLCGNQATAHLARLAPPSTLRSAQRAAQLPNPPFSLCDAGPTRQCPSPSPSRERTGLSRAQRCRTQFLGFAISLPFCANRGPIKHPAVPRVVFLHPKRENEP